MDEAVLRIVLEESGGGVAPTSPAAPAAPSPPPPPPPQIQPTPPPVMSRSAPPPVAPPPPPPTRPTTPPEPPAPTISMPTPTVPLPEPETPAKPESPKPRPPDQAAPESIGTTPPQPEWVDTLVKGIEGANRHVLIEGQSGSGKSMMTRHLAFQRMEQGEDVHVVDPHTPEQWKGAKQVFSRESAGTDATEFLKDTLRQREKETTEAKARGEEIDLKPMTVVLSDFARLLKDTPKLGDELRTLLTEARKFNIAIMADTTALTGAETGLKGIVNIRRNFAQKVQMNAPSAEDPMRTAEVGGKKFETPILPDYQDRFDPSIIRAPSPPPPPEPEEPFDPREAAIKRREGERRSAQVEAAYEQEFGGDEKPMMDQMLDLATQFRGTLGGLVGTIAGAALDAVSAFRSAQVDVKDRRQELLGEIPPSVVEVPEDTPESEQESPSVQLPDISASAQKPPDTQEQQNTTQATERTPDTTEAVSGAASAVGDVGDVVGASSNVSKAIPIAAAVVVAVGATVKAFNALVQVLDQTADRYGEFSPEISQAQAIVEVNRTMGDLRRAQESGPELARFVLAQGELQQRFEDIKIKLLTAISRAVTPILETLESVMPSGEGIENAINSIAAVVRALHPSLDLIAQFQQQIAEESRPRPADPTEVILNTPGGQVPPLNSLP